MQYYDAQPGDTQRQPLEPKSIISGALPGATELRIGDSIKISGKTQQIKVTTTGGNITMGATSDGRLAMEVTNSDGTKTGIGVIPGSTQLGFYTLDASGNVIQKIVGPTRYINDVTNGTVVLEDGKLPDGTYGVAVAKTGQSVPNAFS